MHIFIGTRGNKENVELFIKELSSKYLNIPFYNKKTKKTVNVANPIHVRPFQIWEIICPKEERYLVMATIFHNKDVLPDQPSFRRIYKWILRLLPKCIKKIPDDWDNSKRLTVNNDAVETVGLGIMDDRIGKFTGRSDEQMKAIGLDPKGDWEYESL